MDKRPNLKIICFILSILFSTSVFAGDAFNGEKVPVSIKNEVSEAIPSSEVDPSQRVGFNTVFGDRIVATRIPTLAAQFMYGIEEGDSEPEIVSTGVVDYSNAMLRLQTGVAADGHAAVQSKGTLRYVPGHEAIAEFTAVFTTPVANSAQRIGLFDSDNGFWVGYEGTTLYVARRKDGTDFKTEIDPTLFTPNGTWDPTNGIPYRISYGYLGFAPITFSIMNGEGGWIDIHKIKFPNTSDDTHISNTYLPLRTEVTNTGNTSNMVIKVGSVNASIADGSGLDITARRYNHTEVDAITAGGFEVFAIRNKGTFFGKDNKIQLTLTSLSLAADGNKPVAFYLYKNPTITNTPTWTDINTNNSIVEYSTDIQITPNQDVLTVALGRLDSDYVPIENENIQLFPDDYLVIYADSTNTSETITAMRWKEEF